MFRYLRSHWHGPGGCKQVLTIAIPLILSTSAHTVQLFVDSLLLIESSRDEMAAAAMAGLVHFSFVCFFFGVAGYVSTFVAQYTGAQRNDRVGPAVWQGIYFSVVSGLLLLLLIPCAPAIFHWTNHEPAIRGYEISYFQIMCYGIIFGIISNALSGFFSGRSKTWTIMIVGVITTAVNVLLDYLLIMGRFGFPRLGIVGAAWATVAAHVIAMIIYAAIFFKKTNRIHFHTLSGWHFEKDLFLRLQRFGGPSGLHFMLDVMAFTYFVSLVGQISPVILAATTLTFRINMLAFMPMVGFGIAVSILVGQALGDDNPALARRSTWSASIMTLIYMSIIATIYWFAPGLFLWAFERNADPVQFEAMRPIAVRLLAFVAIYSFFDGGNITFSAALKGAGDTFFVMILGVSLSWLIMVIPAFLAVKYQVGPGDGLYVAWGALTIYVCALACVFLARFLHGKWESMRVTEIAPAAPINLPDVPAVDAET